MRRLTLAMLKRPASGIARVLNVPPDDERFLGWVNEAYEALVEEMKAHGTLWKYQICVTDGCITWPRQIATIEAAAVCNTPITLRNHWFEFLESGIGLQGDGECGNGGCGGGLQLIDRPPAVGFADIIGTNKKVRVYADVAEDSTAKILLQGYDENNNWVRTQPGGTGTDWVDGEYVPIGTSPATSTKFFSSLTGAQKPLTNGTVRLFEYDTTLTTQRAIAIYEPDETVPWYRRSLIPGLSNVGNGPCGTKAVTVMAKLDFIPLQNDTDYLIISSIPAIKDMCQSVRKAEDNLDGEAASWQVRAIRKLQRQNRHYKGDGVVHPIRMPSREVYGGGVTNLI